MYGLVCSTGGVYVPIVNDQQPTFSCDEPTINLVESFEGAGNVTVSKYKINIHKTTDPGGSLIMLLTFSQPVSTASVVISGSVLATSAHL